MARNPIDTDALLKRLAAIGANQATRGASRTSAQPRQQQQSGMVPIQPLPQMDPALRGQMNTLTERARALQDIAPQYKNQIEQIAAGGTGATGPQGVLSSVLNSPPAQGLLKGMETIGIPLRGVTSTMKEARDALDDDPNTRASASDFINQIKDPTFGFGRVMPMEGWKGRLVGFAGDVAFDPLTYLSLGAGPAIRGAQIGAKGVLRAGVTETAEKIALTTALGTKTVAGRSGREALADLVRRYGGTGQEIKDVLARGKSAVPKDIAEVIGLGRSGIYVAGTQIRLPGSGPLADALESGLTSMRLWAGGSKPGRFIQKWITPRGTGSVGVRDLRMDAAAGRISPDEAATISAFLASDGVRRTAANIARDTVSRRVVDLMADPNIELNRSSLYRLIENPNAVASESQRAGVRRIQEFFQTVRADIDAKMKAVDPGWKAGDLGDVYFPHMLSDDAVKALESSFDNPKYEQLMTYLKIDPRDLQGSLKRRGISATQEFMGVPGNVHNGTIEGLNKVTREQLGFDLFETDAVKVIAKYTDVVAETAGTAAMLNNLKDAGVLKTIKERGIIDEDYVAALQKSFNNANKEVGNSLQKMQGSLENLVRMVDTAFNPTERGGVLGRLVAGEVSDAQKALATARNLIEDPELLQSKLNVAADELKKAIAAHDAARAGFNSFFSEQNTLMEVMNGEMESIVRDLQRAVEKTDELRGALSRGEADAKAVSDYLSELRKVETKSKKDLEKLRSSRQILDFFEDEFGTELQRLTDDYGTTFLDEIYVDGELVSAEQVAVRIKYDVPEIQQLMGEIFDPRVRTHNVVGGTRGTKEYNLGEDWIRETISGEGTATKAVFDMIDPTLRTKAGEFGARGKNAWNIARANDELVRGFTIGDNAKGLVEAFYWMTLREMKNVYLSQGKGSMALQEAFARELLEGATPRAQLWNQAAQKVRDVLGVGNRIAAAAGDENVGDAAQQVINLQRLIDRTTAEIDELTSVTNAADAAGAVANMSEDFAVFADNVVSRGLDETNVAEFRTRAVQMLEALPDSAFPEGRENLNALIESIDRGVEASFRDGSFTAENLRVAADQIIRYVDEGVSAASYAAGRDSAQFRASRQRVNQLANERIRLQEKLSKVQADNGNDRLTQLATLATRGMFREQIADMAETLSNYYIFHEAYAVADRAQKLLPSGIVLPESVWSVTVRNVAKEQTRQIASFRSVVDEAYEIMSGVRERVMSIPERSKRAEALLTEVRNLPQPQRESVEKVFGVLNTGAARKNLQELDKLMNADPEYMSFLQELKQYEIEGAVAGASPSRRITRQARTVRMTGKDTPMAPLPGRTQGVVAEQAAAEVVEKFDARSLKSKAMITINTLKKKGLISETDAVLLQSRYNSIRRRVKLQQDESRAILKEEGVRNIRKKRKLLRDRSTYEDSFGVSGAFAKATANISRGTGRKVDDFFTRMLGDGELFTFADGTVRRKQFIPRSDSIIGKTEARLSRRQNGLASVSLDPSVKPEEAVRVGMRIVDDKGNLVLMGPAGYATYLRQRLSDVETAIRVYKDFPGSQIEPFEKTTFTPKAGKARKKMTEAELERERLFFAHKELYDMSRDPAAVRYIDDTLTKIKSRNPNYADPSKGRVYQIEPPPQGVKIPKQVRKALENIKELNDQLNEIDSSPRFLAAKERQTLNTFLQRIAQYDLSLIRNADGQNIIDVSSRGSKYKYLSPDDNGAIIDFANNAYDANGVRYDFVDSYTVHRAEVIDFDGQRVSDYLSGASNEKLMFTIGMNGPVVSDDVVRALIAGTDLPPVKSLNAVDAAFYANDVRDLNYLRQYRTITTRVIDEPVALDALFEPDNSVVVFTGKKPSSALSEAENTVRGATPSIIDYREIAPRTTGRATLPALDEAGNPVVFDALEVKSLFSRPQMVIQGEGELRKLRAKRTQLRDEVARNNARGQFAAAAKKTDEMKQIDDEIVRLRSELVYRNPNMQMAQVQKARMLKNHFSDIDVQRQLGFKTKVSPYVAVERYLELHPEARISGEIVDDRLATLSESWSNTFESRLIADRNEISKKINENAEVLEIARDGGVAAQAIKERDALLSKQASLTAEAGFSVDELLDGLEKKGFVINIDPKEVNVGGAAIPSRGAALLDDEKRLADVLRVAEGVASGAERRARKALTQQPQVSDALRAAAREVRDEEIEAITDIARVQGAQALMSRMKKRVYLLRKQVAEAELGEAAAKQRLEALDIAILEGKPVRKNNKVLDAASIKAVNDSLAADKALKSAREKLAKTEKQLQQATARFEAANSAFTNRGSLVADEREAFSRVEGIKSLLQQMKEKPPKLGDKKNPNWQADFNEWTEELEQILTTLDGLKKTAGQEKSIAAIRAQLVQYAEIRTQMLANAANVKDIGVANADTLEKIGLELLMRQEGDMTPVLGITFARQLEEGFKEFGAQFPNLQGNAKILEIFENANRLKDPAFARAMQRFLSPYTKFFKAWAVATPGFHIRNSISNAFMLVAAGGRPDYLLDGLKQWRTIKPILDSPKRAEEFDKYLAKLNPQEARAVRTAYDAMMGAGGGQASEVNIQFGNVLYSNKVTKWSQKQGAKADDHARFMLAYDGARSGMDYLTAAARVRKFLVDYQDTSSLDAVMRQIVPFWMWTSRNLPLQMVNIWSNPRAYRIYTSFKNNVEDREEGELMPKWMRETGAFMIPGTSFAATPDLPFSRLGQQVEQLRSPKRLAADVNPIIRAPLEAFLADKRFFSDVPFEEGVKEKVSGPVGLLASYLGQPLGQGTTGPGGERLVSDRFLYLMTNLLPLLNQAERLVPSRPEYQQRGTGNQWAGYFGVPVRQVSDEMREAELRRRLRELSNVKQRLPEEEEGM